METIKIEKDSVELKITLEELMILNNSFREVVSDLDWEFKIRTGFKIEEMERIFNPIEGAIETKAKEAKLQFSARDIIGLHQVLNVLCNGIRVDNFEQKIGVPEQEVRKIFDYLNDLTEFLPRKKPIIRTEFRKKSDKQTDFVIRKKCYLKSQEYDLGFYIKKMDRDLENLGFLIALFESGTDKVIVKTNATRIHIKELQDIINFLQAQVNSFDYVKNTLISSSFLDNFVIVNIEKAELDKSDLSEESNLVIEIIFLDKQENSSASEQTSFTDTTTLNNIQEFITSVDDFLAEVRGHIYSRITYIF